MNSERYMAISPGAIIPGAMPSFKIYVLSPRGKYTLWALKGNKVTQEQLAKLSGGGFREVYVDVDEKFKYEQYLETYLGDILESSWPNDDDKAAIFSKVSANVVKSAFESSLGFGAMSMDAVRRTQNMVKNALVFIMESNSVRVLAKMIGHDYQTFEHATKVLWFTVVFLRYNPDIMRYIIPDYEALDSKHKTEVLEQCGVGALLHDIGKVLVSPEILNKNGPLSDVEWEIMKRHPLSGLALLLDVDLPEYVKKAILQHHENFNGGGYPMGLEGGAISVLARLLRIVDTFDAMTSRRPYKEPLAPGKAVKIMIGTRSEKSGDDGQGLDERDKGMRQCFDEEILRKFILFLGNVALDR